MHEMPVYFTACKSLKNKNCVKELGVTFETFTTLMATID